MTRRNNKRLTSSGLALYSSRRMELISARMSKERVRRLGRKKALERRTLASAGNFVDLNVFELDKEVANGFAGLEDMGRKFGSGFEGL